jgi:hypothetical protein
MATANAFDGQPPTAPGSVTSDGLVAILRAGRIETAHRRKCAREGLLIEVNYPQQDSPHSPVSSSIGIAEARLDSPCGISLACLSNRARACSTCWHFASRILERATSITSHPASSWGERCRAASRKSRLARLRAAALPSLRLAATPTRLESRPLGHAISTSKGCVHDRPSSYTRRTSFVRRSRTRRSIARESH